MALLLRHRLPLPVPLLLAFLLSASSNGAPSGDESYDTSLCLWQPSTCGNLSIDYPFYLYKKAADILGNNGSYCGYPGLGIHCEDNKTILQLGGDNKYTVSGIDYKNFTLTVADQEVFDDYSCPRVDHNLTFPGTSWLIVANSAVDYIVFFLNCSLTMADARLNNIDPITCSSLDNVTAGLSFVLPRRDVWQQKEYWWLACQRVFQVPVLKYKLPSDPSDPVWRNDGYGDALRTGFQLMWEQKNSSCSQCEGWNGQCAYNGGGEFVACLCSDGRIDAGGNCNSGKPYETCFF